MIFRVQFDPKNAFKKIAGMCEKKSLSALPLEDICNSQKRHIFMTDVLTSSVAKLRHDKVFFHLSPQYLHICVNNWEPEELRDFLSEESL